VERWDHRRARRSIGGHGFPDAGGEGVDLDQKGRWIDDPDPGSQRAFPKRLAEPKYPNWYSVVTLSPGGRVRLRGSTYAISTALEDERVGFVEVEEGCFEVYFCKLLLGRIHTAHPELGKIAA
jgi:hypothetical protein